MLILFIILFIATDIYSMTLNSKILTKSRLYLFSSSSKLSSLSSQTNLQKKLIQKKSEDSGMGQSLIHSACPTAKSIATGSILSKISPNGEYIASRTLLEKQAITSKDFPWKEVASTNEDIKTVTIVNRKSKRIISTLKGHSRQINQISWSTDSNYLATGSLDKTICIWDVKTGWLLYRLEGHTNAIEALSWHPSGTYIASLSYDNTLQFWDVKTGLSIKQKYQEKVKRPNSKIETFVNWSSVTFSPQGNYLAVGTSQGELVIFNENVEMIFYCNRLYKSSIHSIAWSPNEQYIALSAEEDPIIWIYNLKNKVSLAFQTKLDNEATITALCWSPDNKMFLAGTSNNQVILYALLTGMSVNILKEYEKEEWDNTIASIDWIAKSNDQVYILITYRFKEAIVVSVTDFLKKLAEEDKKLIKETECSYVEM